MQADLKSYDGVSPLFYAFARNCPKSVLLVLNYGIDADTTAFDGIPALAFGIMSSWINLQNGTEVVRTLLAAGARAESIPRDM